VPELVLVVLFLPFGLAAGALLWGGASLLVDAWRCRHPDADLVARVKFQPTLADEAEAWLRHQ
jgi:hypothetical protein